MEPMEPRVRQELPAPRVQLVQPASRARRVWPELKGTRAHRVRRAPLVPLVRLAHRVIEASRV